MALSGTFSQLTQAGLRRVSVRRAVFVLQREGDVLLNEAQREQLWQLFHVPVYVLLVDSTEKVWAYECEAHQGLHLPQAGHAGKIPAGIETSPCGCGRAGPRLRYRQGAQPGFAKAG